MANLRCERLYKSFDGMRALVNFDFEFPTAGITSIIGPNGAGKTTLINVLTGFLKADSGRCYLGDREITNLAPYRIAKLGIARTFQQLNLIRAISVFDNVMLSRPNQRGERVFYAISGIGVKQDEAKNRDVAAHLVRFVGLQDYVNESAGELSYGQQKLLSLACCLATDAQILLLDEPIAGVHPETAERILMLLRQLSQQGKAIIFIEHDIAAVRQLADKLVVIDEGRLIAQGSPTDVLNRAEIMEAYLA